jgi:hypothetical protein
MAKKALGVTHATRKLSPFPVAKPEADFGPVIRALREIQETAQQSHLQGAVDEAKDLGTAEGAAAFKDGRPLSGAARTAAGRAFSANARASYLSYLEQDAKEMASELQRDHEFEPEDYRESATAAIEEHLVGVGDDLIGIVEPRLQAIYASGFDAVANRAHARGEDLSKRAHKAGLETAIKDLDEFILSDFADGVTATWNSVNTILSEMAKSGKYPEEEINAMRVQIQERAEDTEMLKQFRDSGRSPFFIAKQAIRKDMVPERQRALVATLKADLDAFNYADAQYDREQERAYKLNNRAVTRDITLAIFQGQIGTLSQLQETIAASSEWLSDSDISNMRSRWLNVQNRAANVQHDGRAYSELRLRARAGGLDISELQEAYESSLDELKGITREDFGTILTEIDQWEAEAESDAFQAGRSLLNMATGFDPQSGGFTLPGGIKLKDSQEWRARAVFAYDEFFERVQREGKENAYDIANRIIAEHKLIRITNKNNLPRLQYPAFYDMQTKLPSGMTAGEMVLLRRWKDGIISKSELDLELRSWKVWDQYNENRENSDALQTPSTGRKEEDEEIL